MRPSRVAAERAAQDEDAHRPLYARVLRLKHLSPSGLLCFVFLEGAIALGILLALAELVSWWGVIVLPVLVAAMVKLNDVIAGFLSRPAAPTRPVAARASVTASDRPPYPPLVGEESTTRLPGVIDPGSAVKRPWVERLEVQEQWVRQSATHRYD
jgi:hypothetical protein